MNHPDIRILDHADTPRRQRSGDGVQFGPDHALDVVRAA